MPYQQEHLKVHMDVWLTIDQWLVLVKTLTDSIEDTDFYETEIVNELTKNSSLEIDTMPPISF